MTATAKLSASEATLRRRFRVVETPVEVGDRTLSILHPASAEDLIDESEFDRDERLPYWAELWPSARILGEHVLGMAGDDRTLLELGCGSGVVTTCASLARFDVTASDYYDDALRFARVNTWRNGARAPRVALLDWRNLPPRAKRYDVIAASDVLYERPYGLLVARVVAAMLARDGVAYIADPGRVARDEFLSALKPLGLALRDRRQVRYAEGSIRQTITLLTVARID